jgi:outer membrane protein assembly factor BamB
MRGGKRPKTARPAGGKASAQYRYRLPPISPEDYYDYPQGRRICRITDNPEHFVKYPLSETRCANEIPHQKYPMTDFSSASRPRWLPYLMLIAMIVGGGCRPTREPDQANSGVAGKRAGTDPLPVDESSRTETGNWPVFRGPNANSTVANRLPEQFSEERGLVWNCGLPGRGASSPILFEDRVFLTAYTGYGISAEQPGELKNLGHHVICVDSLDGKPLWEREIKATAIQQKINPELLRHGFASSTPATDGKTVFAWFGVTGLFAFDCDGKLLWQRNLGLETHYFGSSASLVLFDDLVIVNASIESRTIYGVEKATGAVRWTIPDIVECWSMPVLATLHDGGTEMIVSAKNRVAGYDPATGEELWHCAGIQDYVVSCPVVKDEVVYLTGGKEKQMMAIRLGGRGNVESSHKIWETKRLGSNVSSPVIRGDRLFVFHDSGTLQVIDIADGKLVHQSRTATSMQPFSSPLLAADCLFMPFQDAGIGIYMADDTIAERTVIPVKTGGPLMASIAVDGNRFLFRNDGGLYLVGGGNAPVKSLPWERPEDFQVIEARSPYNLETEKGWSRRYLLFMTEDPAVVSKYLLMPYQSVITDEQTAQSEKIVQENMPKFLALLERCKAIRQRQLETAANDEADVDPEWEQLEKDVNKLTNDLRILVKKLFSKEQMDKHNADAAAGVAHIKPGEEPK